MLWIPYVVAPILLGIVIALGKPPVRSTSFMLVVLGLAVVQIALLMYALNDWRLSEFVPVLLCGVLAPLAIVVGLARMILPNKMRVIWSVGLTAVYFALVAVGLGVADMLGMLRH